MKKIIRVRPKELSISAPLARKTYETDFCEWVNTQAKLLKSGNLEKLDVDNLIEEIESLGKNDKRSLLSQTIVLLTHLLKLEYQPDGKSWKSSILNAKREIGILIEDSPSLRNELIDIFPKAYKYAKQSAATETGLKVATFPKECPWEIKEILPSIYKKK